MNNFLSLTGMFLVISAVKHDRGQNYADIYWFDDPASNWMCVVYIALNGGMVQNTKVERVW